MDKTLDDGDCDGNENVEGEAEGDEEKGRGDEDENDEDDKVIFNDMCIKLCFNKSPNGRFSREV